MEISDKRPSGLGEEGVDGDKGVEAAARCKLLKLHDDAAAAVSAETDRGQGEGFKTGGGTNQKSAKLLLDQTPHLYKPAWRVYMAM